MEAAVRPIFTLGLFLETAATLPARFLKRQGSYLNPNTGGNTTTTIAAQIENTGR